MVHTNAISYNFSRLFDPPCVTQKEACDIVNGTCAYIMHIHKYTNYLHGGVGWGRSGDERARARAFTPGVALVCARVRRAVFAVVSNGALFACRLHNDAPAAAVSRQCRADARTARRWKWEWGWVGPVNAYGVPGPKRKKLHKTPGNKHTNTQTHCATVTATDFFESTVLCATQSSLRFGVWGRLNVMRVRVYREVGLLWKERGFVGFVMFTYTQARWHKRERCAAQRRDDDDDTMTAIRANTKHTPHRRTNTGALNHRRTVFAGKTERHAAESSSQTIARTSRKCVPL